MAGMGLIDEAVMFSPDMPESVNVLLQSAVIASRNDKRKAEALFMQAFNLDSHCLQSYFALYKFYFYQARLKESENFIMAGLEEAARQGGFPSDFHRLYREQSKWDLYANETTLFYLYTLKALAFIKLRLDQKTQAHIILDIMQELDPEDRSGVSVILDLAKGLEED